MCWYLATLGLLISVSRESDRICLCVCCVRVRVHVCCLVRAGETLLHVAIAKKRPKLIKYLLDHGANVYAQVRHI